ncbi:FimB/Mfa2 family fimbrial subunit [Parabacteroides sp. GYB001]|uniref:FimB/Mfa2 family fimbrial subunit n=1 Tax=Parabacteroides leei TaxID=2939491 RepID=UPI0020179F22|nr:FimB/Mfa2 family fimbrial subunit [Parabacteroides leei]MCL3853463.1 FimB/Mfa2 family fimbrial subunit [Parabacteroides leei]
MRLVKYNIQYRHCLAGLLFLLMAMSGCADEERIDSGTDGYAFINLSVRTSLSSINDDRRFWEDRVDEVRMIAFDSGDGSVVFNRKLYFPDGFETTSNPVTIYPGTYDFYFIANESVYSGDFVSALLDISNKSDFSTDARFTDIAYNSGFKPDGSSREGRFLMSGIYENITVVKGGTEQAPVLLPLPTNSVELIRAMAKVEVVIRKKVPGSTLPDHAVTSIQLKNVASDLSVPPYDNYYPGDRSSSLEASLSELNYQKDSIGAVVFYIPELLLPENGTDYTELYINNKVFAIENDPDKVGITDQRRIVPVLSDNSVIRNYHYIVNAYINTEGEIETRIEVEPWVKDTYTYIFQGNEHIVLPPVLPTDSSIVMPTDCGKIEMMTRDETLSQGLKEGYGDEIIYYDPATGQPAIKEGEAPYYCEKKYGKGWRMINSCELMSYMALLDKTYTIWMSNTWDANTYNKNHPGAPIPYYSLTLRKAAQSLLEKLTGRDLSATVLMNENNWEDKISDVKLGVVDTYYTPGDIKVRVDDYLEGWPFPSPPATPAGESWIYNEAAIQVKAFWYSAGYVDLSNRANWDKVLYGNFQRFDYNATTRCVRTVE